ncbi:MAG: hypothetical protein LUQ18_00065 [Methylococcaceae bacterium]|nr:hypothetical protein [Methylococcaceae bacterium]
MAQEEIILKLKPEEINIILEGVGNLPFVKVYNLIGKIQSQAATQLSGENSPPEIRGDEALNVVSEG